MTPKIIALCSRKPQSGKDTVAKQLKFELECAGNKVMTLAFADALRHNVASLFGNEMYPMLMERLTCSAKDIPLRQLSIGNLTHHDYERFLYRENKLGYNELRQFIREPRSPRWHMQHFGNNYIKGHLGLEDHWVRIVHREVMGFKGSRFDYVIITDARSEVEFNWIDRFDGRVIQVEPICFPESRAVAEYKHPVEQFDYSDYVWATVRNVWGRPETARDDIQSLFNDELHGINP